MSPFAGFVLLVCAVLLHLSEGLQADTTPDRIEFVSLPDGFRLALEQHRAHGDRRAVVVTCHGLGTNRFNMDLKPGVSLVEHLCNAGFEVWNVEMRGNGRSRHVDPSSRAAQRWCFDDHVRLDVPAMLEAVTRLAKTEQVHWVGHSMGGMVMYGHLGRVPDDSRVASVCAIASPSVDEAPLWMRPFASLREVTAGFVSRIPVPLLGRVLAPVYFWFPIDLGPLQPRNLDRITMRRTMAVLPEKLSSKMMVQVQRWVRTGRFVSEDGVDDYHANLGRV